MAALASAAADSRVEVPSWMIILANLLPLCFLSLAVMTEGFPRPPFPAALGIAWFILAVASAGAVGYQRTRPAWLRWAILLGAAALAVAAASHAGNNFWRLHEELKIGMCFIDFPGCPPLPAQAPPWWKLFFG